MRLKRMQAGAAHEGPPPQWLPGCPESRNPSNGVPCAPTLLPLGGREGTCGARIQRVRLDVPPLHFARPPTPGASSWPGATLAIQGGIEGPHCPHPSSGRKARREGEEKAPAAPSYVARPNTRVEGWRNLTDPSTKAPRF